MKQPCDQRLTVLVVEDEPIVRMFGADLLESAGFSVIEAANADEALRVLGARRDVSLVFTDVEMPGSLDGLGLAAAIHERWPQIGVVLTSGRRRIALPAPPGDDAFVEKPYAPAALLRQIETALSRVLARGRG